MRIALCDDDRTALMILEILLKASLERKFLEAQTDSFFCGEDFLSSGIEYDMVFMDVYLKGLKGTDTVRRLSGPGRRQVVFTTVSREHAVEAFGLNAVHYLVKPLTQAAVNEAVDRCLERMGYPPANILEVKSGRRTVPVLMENIVYIEVFDKLSVIHTLKNDIKTYAPLGRLFELLDKNRFMRAQRSYIVNMQYIQSFFCDRVVLQDGTEISLSRDRRASLRKQYGRFLLKLAAKGDI